MLGVNLQLFDEDVAQTDMTGIQALWWDVEEPKDAYLPIGKSYAVATDASGYINLDISGVSELSIGDYGFLSLYKLDSEDHEDSLIFSGKVQTSDIVSGVDMTHPSSFIRPEEWPDLDEPVDGVQKIQMLYQVADIETAANAIAFTVRSAYSVDWGDGNSEDGAYGATLEHTYDYDDVDLTDHYAVITITPQVSNDLTYFNIQKRHSNFDQSVDIPILDITVNSEYLTSLIIGNGSYIYVSSIQNVTLGENNLNTFYKMFSNCYSLQNVLLENIDGITNVDSMFQRCYSLQSIPLLDTSSVTNMSRMFQYCYSLQSIPLLDTSSVTTMSYMFNDCNSLNIIPLLDTSIVTDMSSMFSNCKSLQSIPLLDTSSVTTMSSMFQSCYSLQNIQLLDTSSVTTMSSMFQSCYSLQSIPLLDTSIVTTMSYMFSDCNSLNIIPLLDTSIVTTMSSMFNDCNSLNIIPLLDASLVTTMSNVFNDCYSLQSGALSGTIVDINYSDANLGPEALDEIYTNLGTVTGKTITVTGNWGTGSDDPSIATAKGWTVIG